MQAVGPVCAKVQKHERDYYVWAALRVRVMAGGMGAETGGPEMWWELPLGLNWNEP